MRFPARRVAGCALLAIATLSGCSALTRLSGRSEAMRRYERAHSGADLSQARFVFEDFGTLDTHALRTVATPWKLAVTALLLEDAPDLGLPVEMSSLRPVFERFGFLYPDSIANWYDDRSPRPTLAGPLGITRGMAKPRLPGYELELANLGCSSCHAGALFDREGRPTRTVWIGMPNSSLDLSAYAKTLFRGLQRIAADEAGALATMQRLFPDMSGSEKRTMRSFVFPELRRRLPVLVRTTGLPVPFDNGGPGYTNGVAAFKYQVGALDTAVSVRAERGLTSIPSLWARPFRRSLLVDGVYARPGTRRFGEKDSVAASLASLQDLSHIAAFVTVGTAGNELAAAERAIPRMQEALRFLAQERPPSFPGSIDTTAARAGRELFERRCTGCHGSYAVSLDRPALLRYPNRLVTQADLGTDSLRWHLVDASILGRKEKAWKPFVRQVEAARTGGYVAPLLTGIWATSPYLHNGSVPTLWHMVHPEQRPERFLVGGHRFDLDRVGIALEAGEDGVAHYPAGHVPRSRPALYDTRLPGLSNAGHVRQFNGLGEPERHALIEYLKTL